MKKLTQKQQQMIENYRHALNYYGCRELKDVYKSCSTAKTRAEIFIKNEMQDINKVTNLYASDYTIIGYNSSMFSCAYSVYDWQPKATEYTRRAIVYHTAYNRYIIPFDDTIEQELAEVLG